MSLKVKEGHGLNIVFCGYNPDICQKVLLGSISLDHGISGLGWCLGLEIRVLRLKMTLELFVSDIY